MEFKIYTADDTYNYHSAYVDITSDIEYEPSYRRRRSRWDTGSNSVYPSQYRHTHDPTTEAISKWLTTQLKLNERGINDFNAFIRIGNEADPFIMMLSKIGTRYHLMGDMYTIKTEVDKFVQTIQNIAHRLRQ